MWPGWIPSKIPLVKMTRGSNPSDGWWLAEAASDHADHGYSSERLRLWDADGRLVMIGQQAAAVFG